MMERKWMANGTTREHGYAGRRSDWEAYRGNDYREAQKAPVTCDGAGVWDDEPVLLSLASLLLTTHDLLDQLETDTAASRWALEAYRDGRHSRIQTDDEPEALSEDNESLAGAVVRLTALARDVAVIRKMIGKGREEI